MKKIISFLFIFILFSCKPKQTVIAESKPIENPNANTIANIIKNHNSINRDFKTAFIKANIDYDDPKKSVKLSADIRIKKDEMILVSIKFFGIVMAKALITPTQVKYYEKSGNKFFEGDFKSLSDLLGTELDFKKAQNILLGKAIDDLNKGVYELSSEENAPKLDEKSNNNFSKSYLFDAVSFLLKRQEVTQQNPQRKFIVNYKNYKLYPECVLPEELLIFANQNNKTTTIGINYKKANFNEELTFPYTVPNGYEQIKIN
jgi:hypothetical protein